MASIYNMPSPKGTNRERLFVLHGRQAAFDAAPDNSDDPVAAVIAWARENLDAKGLQTLMAALKNLSGGEPDDDDEQADDDMNPQRPGKPQEPGKPRGMDAAIRAAVEAATMRERKNLRETAYAKDLIEGYFGKVKACDTAQEYYHSALKAMDAKSVPDILPVAALRSLVENLIMVRRSVSNDSRLPVRAMTSAATDDFLKRFPNANRLKRC